MAKKKDKQKNFDRNMLSIAIDSINAIFNDFDSGSEDELIAKTGKSRQELYDFMLEDDEVIECQEDLTSSVLAKQWRIWYKDADENIINALYKWLKKHIDTFADLSVLARLNGYAVAEYVYESEPDENGLYLIKSVLSKDGELDKFKPKRDGRLLYGDDDVEANQDVKFLLLRSKAVPSRPMGRMLILRAYPAVLLRKRGWSYFGQFIARYAQPYVVGKQGGYSDTATFTNELFRFLNGGAVGLSADDDLNIHQLSGGGEAFERLEQMANKRIQKLIVGRVKNSELSVGSRSAQETDDEVRKQRIQSILDLMTQAIQHAIDAMLIVNEHFGKPINAPQGVWFEYEEQTKVDKERAERDKLYCDTGQVKLTEDYMIDVVGFEKHHIKMVEQTPSQTSMPLSLKLSQSHDHHHNHDDDDEYQPDDKIMQAKLQAIFDDLNKSQSYAEFEQKLAKLNLPDGGLIDDLALQMTKQFVKGLAGVEHG